MPVGTYLSYILLNYYSCSLYENICIRIDLNPIVKTGGSHFGPILVLFSIPRSKELFYFQIGEGILFAVDLSVLGKISSKGLDHIRSVAVPSLLQSLLGKLFKLVLQLNSAVVFVASQTFLPAA